MTPEFEKIYKRAFMKMTRGELERMEEQLQSASPSEPNALEAKYDILDVLRREMARRKQ